MAALNVPQTNIICDLYAVCWLDVILPSQPGLCPDAADIADVGCSVCCVRLWHGCPCAGLVQVLNRGLLVRSED